MQIYEIFQRKKTQPMNEIDLGGIAKSVGSAAKAAVKALPQAAASAAGQYLEKQSGIQGLASLTQPQANPYAGPNARDKALAAVATVSKPQAKQQKALYDKAISQLMAEKGVTSIASLNPADTRALGQNLDQQVVANLLQNRLTDYKKLPTEVSADPAVQQKAKDIVSRMDAAIMTLQDMSSYGSQPAPQQLKVWEELTKAAGEALVMLQFDQDQTAFGGRGAPPAAASAAANTAVQKMAQAAAANRMNAQALKLSQSQIANFQSKFPPGTNRQLDAVFQALGLYPTP